MDREAVAAIAALDDDVRRALFTCVRDAPGPVTRESAAATVGISRKLAAFHLDKLVAAGLLSADVEPAERPRVGRAPKVYRPSGHDTAVCVPQREPVLLAEILLTAVRDAGSEEPPREAAMRAAGERGEREGERARSGARGGRLGVERALGLAEDVLDEQGFEPVREGTGLRLRNCPFHPLLDTAPEVVCDMNHAYLCGMLRGLGAETVLRADLAPVPGRCCVAFEPR